jgi:PAS domain-containing protein
VAHLEMSLSDPYAPVIPRPVRSGGSDIGVSLRSIDRWVDAADGASEACLVIDSDAVIVAASEPACELLGFAGPESAIGRRLFDEVLPLLDFTSAATPLAGTEIAKIPSIQALRSERLARGLIRVRSGSNVLTVDVVAAPLCEGGLVIGSLTFFSVV